jgi:hypothetical protein
MRKPKEVAESIPWRVTRDMLPLIQKRQNVSVIRRRAAS